MPSPSLAAKLYPRVYIGVACSKRNAVIDLAQFTWKQGHQVTWEKGNKMVFPGCIKAKCTKALHTIETFELRLFSVVNTYFDLNIIFFR